MVGNEELESWLSTRLNPRIDFEIIDDFDYEEKGHVCIFKIPATTNRPVSFLHEAYIRVGTITRKLKDFPAKEAELVGSVMNAVIPDTTLINCDDDKDYPKGSELLNELNAGYGFVSLHLHGEPTNYLLAGHMYQYYIRLWAKDDERIYNTSEVNAFETNNHLGLLNNKDKPNVVYSIACRTNPYDTPHPFESVTMNLGKAFTSV